MNLAWILLLAQMSPALPIKGRIVCWRNLEHKVVCINSAGEYVPVPIRENPPKPEPMDLPHDICLTCGHAAYPYHPAAASPDELMDVPAIKTGLTVDLDCVHGVCTKSEEWRSLYSCADKTRVLLTSENGKKHCIKFPGE